MPNAQSQEIQAILDKLAQLRLSGPLAPAAAKTTELAKRLVQLVRSGGMGSQALGLPKLVQNPQAQDAVREVVADPALYGGAGGFKDLANQATKARLGGKMACFVPTPGAIDGFVDAALDAGVTDINDIVTLIKRACFDTVSESPHFAAGVRDTLAKAAQMPATPEDNEAARNRQTLYRAASALGGAHIGATLGRQVASANWGGMSGGAGGLAGGALGAGAGYGLYRLIEALRGSKQAGIMDAVQAKARGAMDFVSDKAQGAADGWKNAPGSRTNAQNAVIDLTGIQSGMRGATIGAPTGAILGALGRNGSLGRAIGGGLLGMVGGGALGNTTGRAAAAFMQGAPEPSALDRLRGALAGIKSAAVNPWSVAKGVGVAGAAALGADYAATPPGERSMIGEIGHTLGSPFRRAGRWLTGHGFTEKSELRPSRFAQGAQEGVQRQRDMRSLDDQDYRMRQDELVTAKRLEMQRRQNDRMRTLLVSAGGADAGYVDRVAPRPFQSGQPAGLSGAQQNPWSTVRNTRSLSMF